MVTHSAQPVKLATVFPPSPPTSQAPVGHAFKNSLVSRGFKRVKSRFTNALRIRTRRTPENHVFGAQGLLNSEKTTGLGHHRGFV